MSDFIWYKENKICVQCRCHSAAPNRIRCEVCLLQNSQSRAKKINSQTEEEKEERKKKNREYLRKKREERKKNGLCIMCGKPQCKSSTVFCIDCKIKNQKKNEKRKNGISRSERKEYGLCYRCGKSALVGKSLCQNCYDTSVCNLPERKESVNYVNWKNQNKLIFK